MPLDEYRRMRDFERTAEPSGSDDPDREMSEWERRGEPRFVVQEHHATALHWDFRLERDGVLVSWAVPKGLPPDPRVNNLAVHTEDHPLSYIDFAGEIPRGEYGGGTVHLWDHGTYEELKWSDREVMVDLRGERARGKYVLFKTDGRNWMMHRMDPPEDPSRELVPSDARPVEPVETATPPTGDVRYLVVWPASTRVAVAVDGGRCTARRADGRDVGDDWPVLRPFGRAVGSLPVVLVGQLVKTKGGKKDPGNLFVEDVVWLDGHATTPLPFSTRRSLLERLDLDGDGWTIAPVYDDGGVLLDAARAQGLPGVLAIRAGAPADEPPAFVRP
ncbi:MAG TPA: DNA polymerase ligase N-terminal domain-containing protein [Acidimicrobiales bacterium]